MSEKKEVLLTEKPTAATDVDPPTRLIVCVDGTRYDPNSGNNQTNVHRIYASVKGGLCHDASTGLTYNQVPKYFPGLTLSDDILSKDKLQASLPGQGYHQQIQDVYEICSQLTGERDEVVFFGFGRGAYVVRAVAGLLHEFGALVSAGKVGFGKAYRKVLKEKERTEGRLVSPLSRSGTVTSVSTASSSDFRISPKIRFLGVFDTIKAVTNDNDFDISFNQSIQHLRHAVSLHEGRKALSPELIYPESLYGTKLRDSGRSEIQAWFVGDHNDMGGASLKAGLSLYPVQWMLLEANSCGTWFDFDGTSGRRGSVARPLSVVFPKQENGKNTAKASFTTANGVVVTLQDLRPIHEQTKSHWNFGIRLNSQRTSIRMKKGRTPFDRNGYLQGFCDHAPQGTIIHPSVYLLLDEHLNVALDTKEAKLQRNLEDWRDKMLGANNGITNFGFWGGLDLDDTPDPGAIRVLVCGNTGVGKSTLINKTFGVDVTQSSDRSRGIHNVKQEITFERRPDLIVHDSGGFEAGAETEFIAIEEFLKEKSAVLDVKDRLHVIWFCIDINSPRTLQTATEKLFRAVSTYASEVPIVVVATKKDDLQAIEFANHFKEMKKNKQPFDEEACERHAAEQIQNRLEQIRHEMESVPGGRLDAIVAVSQDDEQSIASLSKTTSSTFDTEKVRLLYIRAQITRIDLKVDLALHEVLRRYKALVRTATGVSFTVSGPTAHRRTAANKVCAAIMNCFGLPTVSAEVAIDALRKNVWNHIGFDFSVALAECINTLGYIGTGFAGGMPAWLVSGALSVPLVVPSTCRLFLTMSCDLILTLVRSFKESAYRQVHMPGERDVQAAARIYRIKGYSEHVHRDIKALVPKRNVGACYKFETIRQTIEGFLANYKDKLMDDVELPFNVQDLRISGGREEEGESLAELQEANKRAAVELEATGPMPELPPEKDPVELETNDVPRVELSADEKRFELEAAGSIPRIQELEG